MPTILPLQFLNPVPTWTVYEVSGVAGGKNTGNGKYKQYRSGTFYDPSVNARRKCNCGATGFEFEKPSSGTPTYLYYPSMNKSSWEDDFLYGTPTYTDASHPSYSFWQSVSPNLYSFLNAYHSGGLPINKPIKVWVSWDKYISVGPRGFQFIEDTGEHRYTKGRPFAYIPTSPAGVCCRYAIFS
jgi:hypothetical protein